MTELLPFGMAAFIVSYGAIFLVIGVLALLEPRDVTGISRGGRFVLLGAFGLLHAAYGMLRGIQYATAGNVPMSWSIGLLLAASFLALFEFARQSGNRWAELWVSRPPAGLVPADRLVGFVRLLCSPWIYPAAALLMAAIVASASDRVAAFAAASRYVLAAPAAISTGFVFLRGFYDVGLRLGWQRSWRSSSLGGGFIAYGLLAGLIVDEVVGFPPWVPTTAAFLRVTGVPIEVARALAMLVAAVSLHAVVAARIRAAFGREMEAAALARRLAQGLEQQVAHRTEELASNARHLKEAQQLAQIGSWEWVREGRAISVSDEFHRILETGPGATPRDAFSAMYAGIDAADRAAFEAADRAMLRDGVPYELTVRVRMADGRRKWIHCRTHVDGTANPRPARAWGTIQDVSERKQAELALAEERELSATLIETMPVIMLKLAIDGTILRVNRHFETMSGMDRTELVGRNWLALFVPDEARAAGLEQTRALLTGGEPYAAVAALRLPDGQIRWIEWHGRALEDPSGGPRRLVTIGIDITDQRALREAEELQRARLQGIFDNLAGFVGLFAPDGTLLDANRLPLDLARVRREDVIGKLFWDTPWWSHSAEMRAKIRASLDRVTAGEVVRDDFEVVLADGTLLTLDIVLGPARDDAGRVVQIVGHGIDVTERRRTEASLVASEERLNEAQRLARMGSWELDHSSQRWVWSDNVYAILGLDPAAGPLPLAEVGNFVHPDDRALVGAAFQGTIDDGAPSERSFRIVTARGDIRWVRHVVKVERDAAGRPLKTWGTLQDITDAKLADLARQVGEARLNEAQRLANLGSWELDLRVGTLVWSDQIYRMFEIGKADFAASYSAFLDMVHPEDRALVDGTYSASVANRTPYELIHRLLMADGRIKWVRERAETEYDQAGNPMLSRGTIQDITEAKLMDDALRRSLAQGETLLREVHHRVKNNLQMIASLLYFQGKKVTDPAGAAVLEEIRDRLRAMMLVHEKLYRSADLSRIEFAGYVRSLAAELAGPRQRQQQSVRVRVDGDVGVMPVEVALPCGMMICELLTNALKYAYRDGEAGEISVDLAGHGDGFSITVRDQGRGLPGNFNAATAGSFGWRLIGQLAAQIGASVSIGSGPGTAVTIAWRTVAGAA